MCTLMHVVKVSLHPPSALPCAHVWRACAREGEAEWMSSDWKPFAISSLHHEALCCIVYQPSPLLVLHCARMHACVGESWHCTGIHMRGYVSVRQLTLLDRYWLSLFASVSVTAWWVIINSSERLIAHGCVFARDYFPIKMCLTFLFLLCVGA